MTIIIGIQAKDGAVLAGDCQITNGSEKRPWKKIYSALNRQEEDESGLNSTGIYYGSSGSHAFVDIGLLAKGVFSQSRGAADLLTDDYILKNSMEYFNDLITAREKDVREVLGRRRDSEYHQAEEAVEYATLCRDVRAFIDSAKPGTIFDLNRIVLRISETYGPDLLYVENSSVVPVSCKAIGSGRKLVEHELLGRYSPDFPVEDALLLIADAMNLALADEENYSGYQLVIVKRLGDGGHEIRTALDPEAHAINLREVKYLDECFYAKS